MAALELALRTDSEGADQAALPGVTGSVSDALRVEKGYETAIAQGPWLPG